MVSEAGVHHAERTEDVLAEVDVERLVADRFDRRPTQSMLMPYSHRSPGSNSSGSGRARHPPVLRRHARSLPR